MQEQPECRTLPKTTQSQPHTANQCLNEASHDKGQQANKAAPTWHRDRGRQHSDGKQLKCTNTSHDNKMPTTHIRSMPEWSTQQQRPSSPPSITKTEQGQEESSITMEKLLQCTLTLP